MYDQFAADYDRFVNWTNRLAFELPFIEAQLNKLSHPTDRPLQVLETACGTAMHSVGLARLGFQMSAADLNAQMVEKARLNASAAGVDLKVKTAGFGSLAETFGKESFDAILCMGNSLPHLLSANEVKQALQDFAACLRPGGWLLIQNRNFDAVVNGHQRWMEPQAHSEAGNEWVFFLYYDFLAEDLIDFNVVTSKKDARNQHSTSIGTTQLRPQLQKELALLLGDSGFESIHSYGSMQGDLFIPLNSGNLILTAIKRQ
ncbi:MAG: class I SAM-dependent methyltransferase [Anaerolineaceae bacterium]|nr:class I SAM-dependent methyltransferase [Anaerolineaceae bacterium]